MPERARIGLHVLQLIVLIAILVVQSLILCRMPSTVGDEIDAGNIKDEKLRAKAFDRLENRTPLARVEVDGEVEASLSNSSLDVEVKNEISLDDSNVLQVEIVTDPVPVQIQR